MKDDQLYREHILDLWQYPHNFGVLARPDISAERSNVTCGDTIQITAKLKAGKLYSVRFNGQGCVIAMAAASILTDFVQEKTIAFVKSMQAEEMISQLSVPITPARLNCALLSFQTLQTAIASRESKF